MSILSSLLIALAVLIPAAEAAAPFTLEQFSQHDLDSAILGTLGYQGGSVLYFKEMGSINQKQQLERQEYEQLGCDPFYVLRSGKVEENGYNCRTFFCVGYMKGPKVCQDRSGKPYGGIVEINRRVQNPLTQEIRRDFSDYPESERTTSMQQQLDELTPLGCTPYTVSHFGVIVAEGYVCGELGSYPSFAAKVDCLRDWRKSRRLICLPMSDSDHLALRRKILGLPPASSSSKAASSAGSSASAFFPDVEQGKYGYTAILELAKRGTIQGYGDGTFRPKQVVNRAEFLKLLIVGLHPEQALGEQRCFPDVRDEWFSPVVCAAKRLQWVKGYRDGRFRPAQTITKAEGIKIILSSLAVPLDSVAVLPAEVPNNAWFTPYIRKAVDLGIILESVFFPGSEVSRADAAVWMYRAMKSSGQISASGSAISQ